MKSMSVDPAFRLLAAHRAAHGPSTSRGGSRGALAVSAQAVVEGLKGSDPQILVESIAGLLYAIALASVEADLPLPWSPRPRPRLGALGLPPPAERRHLASEVLTLEGAFVSGADPLGSGEPLAAILDDGARLCHRMAAACGVPLDSLLLDLHRAAIAQAARLRELGGPVGETLP